MLCIFKKEYDPVAPGSQIKCPFFILAYSFWRKFILFIAISVTFINIYQLVLLFFSKLVHLKMSGVNEDSFKSGTKITTLNDFPVTSSDLDVRLLDMKLSHVKRFFEEKAWLLVKKRKVLTNVVTLFVVNTFTD